MNRAHDLLKGLSIGHGFAATPICHLIANIRLYFWNVLSCILFEIVACFASTLCREGQRGFKKKDPILDSHQKLHLLNLCCSQPQNTSTEISRIRHLSWPWVRDLSHCVLSTKSILSLTYIAVKILNSTMLYLIISYTHAPSCFPRRFAEPLAFGISRHRCVSRACFRSVVEIVTHCTLSYGRHHCSRQKQSNLLTGAPIGLGAQLTTTSAVQ